MLKSFFLAVIITGCLLAQQDTSIVYIGDVDSTILMDVRYATTNNFTGKVLYPTDKVYLRKVVADSLTRVQTYLKERYNLRIKVFDGYRPLSVQWKLWEIVPDDRYVADPRKGSRHNRGAAVDLTLVDSLGNEIDMGTPYDDFTEKAHRNYKDFDDDVLKHRAILDEAMIKFGFEPLSTEWWHFDFKGWKRFSLLNININ